MLKDDKFRSLAEYFHFVSWKSCHLLYFWHGNHLHFKKKKTKPKTPGGCVVSTMDEKDLTASQDMYDDLAKESYNVLNLTTVDTE